MEMHALKYTELLKDGPVVTFEFTPNNFDKATYRDIDHIVRRGVSGISITTHDTKGKELPFHTNFDIAYQLGEMYRDYGGDSHYDRGRGIAVIPHISCSSSYRDIDYRADRLHEAGMENILVIRSDGEKDEATGKRLPFKPHPGGPKFAYELIERIRDRYDDICIGAACYPEGHEETQKACAAAGEPFKKVLEMEIEHLYAKKETGADFFFSQICFDNDIISEFIRAKESAGISEPVGGGVKAITKYGQAESIASTFCVRVPDALRAALERYKGDKELIRQTGLDYAAGQNRDMISRGISVQNYATRTTPVRDLADRIFGGKIP